MPSMTRTAGLPFAVVFLFGLATPANSQTLPPNRPTVCFGAPCGAAMERIS